MQHGEPKSDNAPANLVTDDVVDVILQEAAVTLEKASERMLELHQKVALLTIENGQLTKALAEAQAVCVCGCEPTEHESYGEEGESCGVPGHDCFRTSKAVVMLMASLRGEL